MVSTGRCSTASVWLVATLLGAALAAPCSSAAATFTVTSAADTGGSTCSTICTLRQAINAANAAAGADTINFNISGGGVQTIAPASALPTITSPVTIDGYTQPGSVTNTASIGSNAVLEIEIDGSGLASGGVGLRFGAGSAPSTVRGLVVNRFKSGTSVGEGILFAGSANGGAVRGCFLGTDATGKIARPNSFGVVLVASYTGVTIGGTTLADRNVIAGNFVNGVELDADSNTVQGNLIGVAADGVSLLGNGASGVLSEHSGNVVGGTAAGAGNTIAGNLNGVLVTNGATGVTIEGNAIFGNRALGIDLSTIVATPDGVTANDIGDADTGSNDFQNFPVLTGAGLTAGGGTLGVIGTLNSTASRMFRIEFFANTAADPSGFGEGQRFLGSTNVTTNASGNASFTVLGAAGGVTSRQIITATATDAVTGDTSEFSAGAVVAGTTTVINTNDSGTGSLRQAILNANSQAGADTIDFAIPGAGVHKIRLLSALPTITDAVTIDGYTQPGAAQNTLVDGDDAVILIELDGTALAGSVEGIALCASNSVIRGLSIGGFPRGGIAVGEQADVTKCAAAPAAIAVEGNFVGLAADGSGARPNGEEGILVTASSATRIGGAAPAQRNVVSANSAHGIIVVGGATGAKMDGNYVGTDASGQLDRGNASFGILLSFPSSGAVIGDAAPNLIAYNPTGIEVLSGSTGNKFAQNAIHHNDALGIDLCAGIGGSCPDGVTANDTDDADSGGNNLQNFPVILSVTRTATGLAILGTLDRPATAMSLTFKIGVYANAACDSSGFGEGEHFLGSFDFVSANASAETFADVAFATTQPLPAGTKITLTATDPSGNTSEFSQCADLDVGAQTFSVNSTADSDDGNCTADPGGCTLREAINAANAHAGADTIAFNIPGNGVHVISPTTPLPTITDPVTIDGYSQPGASPNTLAEGDDAKILIRIDGASAPNPTFGFGICASNTIVQGLSITGFSQRAVAINTTSAGAPCSGASHGVRLSGNFVGLAPDGSAAGNQFGGVVVFGPAVVQIGGTSVSERNVISANDTASSIPEGTVSFVDSGVAGSTVLGNYIGTDPSGLLDRGNQRDGLEFAITASGVLVGGAAPNRIALNRNWIVVDGGANANILFANELFSNSALAIDLLAGTSLDGATPNDPEDADSGGNGLQNFPVLASAVQDGSNMRIAGTLDVPAGNTAGNYVLAFYANSSCTGRGQGEMYLGHANVALSGASEEFVVDLAASAPIGSQIAATATSANGTSEFSTCKTLAPGDHIFVNGFELL